MSTHFKVTFERDGAGWLAQIPSVQGCHTQGATIEEARERIREALAVSLDDPARDRIAETAIFDEEILA